MVASTADLSAPRPSTLRTLCGLLLALGGISLPLGHWLDELAGPGHVIVNELIYWALVVAVLCYVKGVERRPLTSVGLRRPSWKDGLWAVATGLLILVCLGLIYYVLFPALHWSESQQFSQLATIPYALQCLIVVRAAVSEELLFRGYAVERLQELSGSRLVAGALSCTVFTLDHVTYWGWHHILVAGSAGIILTVFYFWRRNLWASMLAHFIVDGAAFLLG
ncbi:CPBP family intramembrane glutamic endopeptidase [Dyella acidiphila]|uniref:CPBP family intramembrane metalloprotease n=1 Tax=Dyella acidiphila TaxID=2775866 RepID=A0ABR9G9H9_9GAMM|nr:type II CAAX endopeptidase family protein [Dyella acidiphila]MBE1160697.1 CPBP family intramembrane metalloprotease [Dyella acidiphila]